MLSARISSCASSSAPGAVPKVKAKLGFPVRRQRLALSIDAGATVLLLQWLIAHAFVGWHSVLCCRNRLSSTPTAQVAICAPAASELVSSEDLNNPTAAVLNAASAWRPPTAQTAICSRLALPSRPPPPAAAAAPASPPAAAPAAALAGWSKTRELCLRWGFVYCYR